MKKLQEVLDAQVRNQRFGQYDINVVMVPFEHVRSLSKAYNQQKTTISTDRHLTDNGKEAALAKARETTRAAINEWHESRLKKLDADLLEQKAALMSNMGTPDPKRVELMSSHLLKHTVQDVVVLYGSATEPERREMETASAALGRVPMKTAQGLAWTSLLDPEMVNESILARAEKTNPTAAQKVRELTAIRAMQVTITGVALSEI